MNEVNKTLYIPLYGKAKVSAQGIILNDKMAQSIWEKEAFPVHGKSASKWLAYNMAMRARVFDDWTKSMLEQNPDALVLHIGCGLDSRCMRISVPYTRWFDVDFEDVIDLRRNYYSETANYTMLAMDVSDSEQLKNLPSGETAIVILEGISMYLSHDQLSRLFRMLEEKFRQIHLLMDVYTVFGAKVSKYKNPVNDVGVTNLYGIDDATGLLGDTRLKCVAEHIMTPDSLIAELKPFERFFFKSVFAGKTYRKIYRLYEFESK